MKKPHELTLQDLNRDALPKTLIVLSRIQSMIDDLEGEMLFGDIDQDDLFEGVNESTQSQFCLAINCIQNARYHTTIVQEAIKESL